MSPSTIIALIVSSIFFVEIAHSVDFKSNRQLGSMVYYLSGQSPDDFTNYGCWCSNKDRPTLAPLDDIDRCCHSHKTCNIAGEINGNSYPYRAVFEDGTIECINNQGTKAYGKCSCDLELAECLHKYQNTYTNNFLYTSNEKCNPSVILNFDDLLTNTTFRDFPENYHDFKITGGHYSAGKDAKDPSRISGYATAMISPPNVAFSQNQMTIKRSDGQLFSIVSFSAASAFVRGLKLTIVGTRQHSPVVYNETFYLQIETRSMIHLDWSDIDTLTLTGTGGTGYPLHTGPCGNCHFAMDDMRFRL